MGGSARTRVEWTWVMRSTDQWTAVGIFAMCWLGLLVFACRGGLSELTEEPPVADPRHGDERVAAPLVSFEVDVNRADWPEWALLPGVGETLAKRIVEHRLRVGGFATVDEVARVRGIGPKSLVRLRPYLVRRENFPVPPTPSPRNDPRGIPTRQSIHSVGRPASSHRGLI